jgi:hypothetical protein
MKLGSKKSTKLFLTLLLIYGIYLLKTIMGINVSNQYSAPRLLKVPLEPIWANKTEICNELQALCLFSHKIQQKVQHQIEQAKHAT